MLRSTILVISPSLAISVDSLALEISPYAFMRIYTCDCEHATNIVPQAEGACLGKVTIIVLDAKHGFQHVVVDISH